MENSRKNIIIGVVAIVIILLIVGIIVFALNNDKENTNDNTNENMVNIDENAPKVNPELPDMQTPTVIQTRPTEN